MRPRCQRCARPSAGPSGRHRLGGGRVSERQCDRLRRHASLHPGSAGGRQRVPHHRTHATTQLLPSRRRPMPSCGSSCCCGWAWIGKPSGRREGDWWWCSCTSAESRTPQRPGCRRPHPFDRPRSRRRRRGQPATGTTASSCCRGSATATGSCSRRSPAGRRCITSDSHRRRQR